MRLVPPWWNECPYKKKRVWLAHTRPLSLVVRTRQELPPASQEAGSHQTLNQPAPRSWTSQLPEPWEIKVTPSMSFVTAAWTDRDRRGRIVARVCWIVNIPGSVGHLPTIRPWLQPTIRETPSAEGEGKVRGRLVWVSHRMPLFFMWEGNMLLAHWSHRYTVSFRLLVP